MIDFISTSEAARRLGVTPQCVRRWAKDGFAIRLKGRWRVPIAAVEKIETDLAEAQRNAGVRSCTPR